MKSKTPFIYNNKKQTRDFTYIPDVVNANILAMQSNATGVFNTAGGKQITINELVKIISQQIDKEDIKPVYKDPRPGDIKHSYADSSKAKEQFAYECQFDIKNGLMETVK